MTLAIRDDPTASAEQVRRLAKEDLTAALSHPCAPIDLLLSHPEHFDLILDSPAWGWWCLTEPAQCKEWRDKILLERAQAKIKDLCKVATTDDRRRVVAWAVECAGTVSAVWREYASHDKRPALARRAALRWVTDAAANANAAANASAYAANAYAAAYDAAYAAAYAANANAAAYDAAYAAANAANAYAYAYAADRLPVTQYQLTRLLAHLNREVAWVERVIHRNPSLKEQP